MIEAHSSLNEGDRDEFAASHALQREQHGSSRRTAWVSKRAQRAMAPGNDVRCIPPSAAANAVMAAIADDQGHPSSHPDPPSQRFCVTNVSALELSGILASVDLHRLMHWLRQSGLFSEVEVVSCTEEGEPFPEVVHRHIPTSALWKVLRLALNQLTVLQIDHYAVVNATTKTTRPDFLLVPALFPISQRYWELQQRMLSYFVNFPLPRTATGSTHVFVSVFMDSYEALGGDPEFAFWFLFARTASKMCSNLGGAKTACVRFAQLWESVQFLRELEPDLRWPTRPDAAAEAQYDAHLSLLEPRSSMIEDDSHVRVSWLLITDLASRGGYSAVLLLQAMARHPAGLGRRWMTQVWVQWFQSVILQGEQRNRRVDWSKQNAASSAVPLVVSDASIHKRASIVLRQVDAVENDGILETLGCLLADPAHVPPFHEETTVLAPTTETDAAGIDGLWLDDEPEQHLTDHLAPFFGKHSLWLADPSPERRAVTQSFLTTFCLRTDLKALHHRLPTLKTSADRFCSESTHATLIKDYHLSLALKKAGLPPSLVAYIVDHFVHCPCQSTKERSHRLFLQDFCTKEIEKMHRVLEL